MKRVLKIIGIALGVMVILILGFVAYIALSPLPSYKNEAPDITIAVDSARVAEGARIASMYCVNCHGSEDGLLGGRYLPENDEYGKVYAPNISSHPTYGAISKYTDGQLVYFFRTGIRPDGIFVPPMMPRMNLWSDEDLYSVVAFLRSDHPMMAPSDLVQPKSKYSLMSKFLFRFILKPLSFPKEPILAPSPEDKVALGRYLATTKWDCYGCHSADYATNNPEEPEKSKGFFGGGNKTRDEHGNMVLSSNLTMDEETGLGKWTEQEFITAVKSGVVPNGPALRHPMRPYAALTDEEVSAIWAYLQTVPVIQNKIQR